MRTMAETIKKPPQIPRRKYVRRADWESIEAAYRLNKVSTRAVAKEHGITESSIRKRAKAENWPRDLAVRVRSRSDAMVRTALASVVRQNGSIAATANKLLGEVLEVEIEAMVQSRIRISHRTDIARSRGVVVQLLSELESLTGMHVGDVPQLPGLSFVLRVGSMKTLADALRTLIDCERKAFGLDDVVISSQTFEQRLTEIANV